MIPTLLLLADDLTGAADCAAYAPGAGFSASIHLAAPNAPLAAGVHAFSTNSRAVGPAAAQAALRALCARLPLAAGALCFKKIDSLLRGNVGAEVETVLEMMHAPAALICPALPAQGRSVVDGCMVGAPATNEAPHTSIAHVLATQSALPQAHIELALVQAGGQRLRTALAAAMAQARLIPADAQSDADLETLVSAWRAVAPAGLLCGSAGLAAAWLRALAPAARPRPAASVPPMDLVVVGSASAMAHAQIAAAAALPHVTRLAVGTAEPPKAAPCACLLLHLPAPAAAPTAEARARAAAALARAAHIHMQHTPVAHVLVAGGDTAQALLPLLGVASLEVVRAARPGMPTCRALYPDDAPLWVTLKAGNHGVPDTIARLVQGED